MMPHVIVKPWPGRSEKQKAILAGRITTDLVAVPNYGEESVSVAMEEATPEEWAEKVNRPNIVGSPKKLYKKPEYSM